MSGNDLKYMKAAIAVAEGLSFLASGQTATPEPTGNYEIHQ
jgi:hypothetical protein